MNVMSVTHNGETTICLEGELDHHAAKPILTRIMQILDIEAPHSLVIDLKSLSFMDSSGIAVILQTFRRTKTFGNKFSVINIPTHAFRIFHAAGLTRMIPMHERPKTERRTPI